MNILWSPQALEDLLSLRDYIAEENPKAAQRERGAVQVLRIYHGARRWPDKF